TPRPLVRELVAGGAGEQAGLRQGDIIVAAGPMDEPSASELVEYIQGQAGQAIALTVLRDKAPIDIQLTPQAQTDAAGERVGRIGVMLGADFPMVTVRYGVVESAWRGVTRTVDTVWF